MTRVVIIGSGAVAEALCVGLAERVIAVVARNESRGRELAALCGAEWSAECIPVADLYLISVSDRAIGEVSESWQFPEDAVVAHTAGCPTLDTLSERIRHRAVFYPMQTFTRGRRVDWREIPIFVEGATEHALKVVQGLACEISEHVEQADSTRRSRLHLGATWVCNFVNMMFVAGSRAADTELTTYRPLVEECVRKAMTLGPQNCQTGVAIRGDVEMQQRHAQMLHDVTPEFEELYKQISKTIWETLRKI
ncbi:MAG: DUF2520 domain-containing protein [Rikenellaceae bacterium]|nr:DUF2520 domain-containing protein [Rikenellaceae bacterium]